MVTNEHPGQNLPANASLTP
jgi:hypothetical protein